MGMDRHSLFPADPYFIPGYGGFCPQFQFQIGHSYGATTHNLLTDPRVRQNRSTVLSPTTNLEKPPDALPAIKGTIKGLRAIPGYSGCIPLRKDLHGSPYCSESAAAKEKFLRLRRQQDSNRERPVLLTYSDGSERISVINKTVPLTAKPLPSGDWAGRTAHLDPKPSSLARDRDTPLRAIAGYTGFVPTYRWSLAQSYQPAVREAMGNFDHNQFILQNPGKTGETARLPSLPELYTKTGMLPHYTGFIPGVRYKHGLTFGQSSRESYW
uniref:Ciliary microtubule inner protein 2B n=1 Tax=Lepisosteus oculatus TaxID=7918 RepID=W5M3C9_LEPOC